MGIQTLPEAALVALTALIFVMFTANWVYNNTRFGTFWDRFSYIVSEVSGYLILIVVVLGTLVSLFW